MILYILSCCKTKNFNNSNIANEVYSGQLFTKSKQYVELLNKNYIILSAKYGFINKKKLIENYNITFKDKKTNPIDDDILLKQCNNILKKFNIEKVIAICGSDYYKHIKNTFGKYIICENFFDDLKVKSMGYNLQYLTNKIKELKNEKSTCDIFGRSR